MRSRPAMEWPSRPQCALNTGCHFHSRVIIVLILPPLLFPPPASPHRTLCARPAALLTPTPCSAVGLAWAGLGRGVGSVRDLTSLCVWPAAA